MKIALSVRRVFEKMAKAINGKKNKDICILGRYNYRKIADKKTQLPSGHSLLSVVKYDRCYEANNERQCKQK